MAIQVLTGHSIINIYGIIMIISILTSEEIVSIIIGAVVGAIATFIIWIIPTEAFKPKIKIDVYNQIPDNVTFIRPDGNIKEKRFLKRNVHIVNGSSRFAAYNVTCFVELLDANGHIVYREDKALPVVKANISEHPIVLPFRKLTITELEETKATSIRLNLVYENRYGTKKTTGPWYIKKYNYTDQTFIPELEK